MQFSEQWLREWVNPAINSKQLAETLTLLGLEVDSCTPIAEGISGVVVGSVLTRVQHPNADRLSFCTVDIGAGAPLEVVCGAPNVRAGLKVAFVKVGGVLPGNFTIKPAKLRGIDSYGMICSLKDLGLGDNHAGIIELPLDAPVGMDFIEYLQLNDHVIDIELTPNRGDCTSIRGIARDVAAKLDLTLIEPVIHPVRTTLKDTLPIEIQATTECPRYVGRVIRHINNKVATPLAMVERLRRAGLRSINPIVDISNYVMLEYGQPLHAFDLEHLEKKIVVRNAFTEEKIKLLDEQEATLSTRNLVIADVNQVQAVAGIMGGLFSAVTEQTQHIFLESAFFNAETIAKSARTLGITTDSSYRFERGVDFELQNKAVERFCQLVHEICGGEFGPLSEVKTDKIPQAPVILLRQTQIERVLGVAFSAAEIVAILTRLGMTVKTVADGWQVTPPSYRFDITIEVDLIEELARIKGYDALPCTHLQGELAMRSLHEVQLPALVLQRTLVNLGYLEAITYSFVDPKIQQYFYRDEEILKLDNPITIDQSEMRISLWPGLIQALNYNLNRQAQRVRLFETGLCFLQKNGELTQQNRIAGLLAGFAHELQWGSPQRAVDFFDVKGDVEQLLQVLGLTKRVTWQKSLLTTLHPGQSADLYLENRLIGSVGQLHPTLVVQLDLSTAPYIFELDLTNLNKKQPTKYQIISKFPAVRRDLAIVIDNQVSAQVIETTIQRFSGDLLQELKIFDIYQGEGIESGKKSVALGLTFQDCKRTLLDEEVNQVIERVVKGLATELNASIRA